MRQPLKELLPLGELPQGSRVLDLGCGSGTVAYESFPHLQFVAADQFVHKASAGWPTNAALALADAERLPWREGTFDAAICNFVFEHFADPVSALRELDRVIRVGGLLYISVPRASSLQDRLYRFVIKGGGHLQSYSMPNFVQMVYRETGFKLEGYADAAGGFTWMRELPYGEALRRILFRSFRLWREATGWDPVAASDFLLLFRLAPSLGYKVIDEVCSHCGDAHDRRAAADDAWVCPACGYQNLSIGQ